ncbi:MAG: aldehyde dehydrogenase family protein [Omnitrophica WOR_2 bacterium]
MENTRYLELNNPATGEKYGQVPMSTPEEIRQAMQEMRLAVQTWADFPVHKRVQILGKLQSVLVEAMDEITDVINRDTGKSRQDALIELWMTLDLLRVYRSQAARWLKTQRVPRGYFFFKQCYVEHRPYGVVLVISPWNYPFYLAMPPVMAALLAGNTVLLKPSEVTAATGLLIERLFKGVPELSPYIRVLHGDGSVGAAVVKAAPDYIFLTGSTTTGRKVMEAAAENLIPVACELGGKDAVIVLEDADIDRAAYWITRGSFFNSGQTCIASSRIYVVETVYEQFMQKVLQYTTELKIGYSNELESTYFMGSMTDPRQLKVIDTHMQDALEKGARLLSGGKRSDMFVEPLILVDVDHRMQIMREETFGPVMPVMKVKDEADAIRKANDSNFGLSTSIWSNNIKRARRVAHQIQAGAKVVNDTLVQIAVPTMPFGGMKQSGYGRIHGKEGLMQFTQTQSYAISAIPKSIDLGVILRSPMHYGMGSKLMHLLFGTGIRQRLQPFIFKNKPQPEKEKIAVNEPFKAETKIDI